MNSLRYCNALAICVRIVLGKIEKESKSVLFSHFAKGETFFVLLCEREGVLSILQQCWKFLLVYFDGLCEIAIQHNMKSPERGMKFSQ